MVYHHNFIEESEEAVKRNDKIFERIKLAIVNVLKLMLQPTRSFGWLGLLSFRRVSSAALGQNNDAKPLFCFKVLNRKNAEIDDLKRHYKNKEKEGEESRKKLEKKGL